MRYLAFILAALTSAEMQAFGLAPRLVVNITIDQLRTDYIEAFAPFYTQGGFRRLMRDGMIYDGAAYPFSPVDRASASATLSTGTTPYYHGIIARQWLDRVSLQPVSCVDPERGGGTASPVRLKTSTLGDELKVSSNGSAVVYAFAPDRESAILSAGHAADGAFWYQQGHWQGTPYYTASPEWVKSYNRLHSSAKDQIPDINDNVVDISLQAISSAAMGRDDVSDMLYVTLSAASEDLKRAAIDHSQMEGIYRRLDQSLERLISGIERQVDHSRILFVVTSTGYVEAVPDDFEKYRIPTGNFYIDRTANLLNMYLGAIYGQGRYVEQTFGNQIYINHKLVEQKRLAMSEILSRCQEFLMQNAGVADVYTSSRLLTGNSDILTLRNGFNAVLSGDIIVEVAPGWKLVNETTHTSYTSRAGVMPFPIIFMGTGIKPQHVSTPVTVDYIAPTIAKAIRIRAPNACSASPLF